MKSGKFLSDFVFQLDIISYFASGYFNINYLKNELRKYPHYTGRQNSNCYY